MARGFVAALTTLAGFFVGCGKPPPDEVVVYTSLDRQFSEPILQRFTEQTGIVVKAVYDTESTKTIGLVNRVRAEAQRPRCDVFWNNEIIHTLRLKQEGLLQPCKPAEAASYPAQFRDAEGYWFGFAGRARVLIVNTELVPPNEVPTSIRDLANSKWKGRVGLPKPLFGSTATHVACLFAALGEREIEALFGAVKANDVQIVAGCKACAELVGAGKLALGLTDTDDAIEELDAGHPVRIVMPDQGEGGMGALLLPNALSLVKGCAHPAAGERLINYLLSAEVEGRLAEGPSAQIPLHASAAVTSRAGRLRDIRALQVDFTRAAEMYPAAAKYIEEQFLAP